jgi:hypothetical protein
MRRISLTCAAAGLAVAALAASSPAKATPFHVIRWDTTGVCQVWDNGIPTTPWPGDYHIVTRSMPTYDTALRVKGHMLRHGHCTL